MDPSLNTGIPHGGQGRSTAATVNKAVMNFLPSWELDEARYVYFFFFFGSHDTYEAHT